MSWGNSDATKPYEEILALLDLLYERRKDAKFQSDLFQECHTFLVNAAPPEQWLCDQRLYRISSHLLVLFSFPTSEFMVKVQQDLQRSITSCSNCRLNYYRAKADLKTRFSVEWRIPFANVDKFLNVMNSWELTVIEPFLRSFQIQSFQSDTSATIDPEKSVLLSMCLCNSALLFKNPALNDIFEEAIHLKDYTFKFSYFYPILMSFLFTGTPQEQCLALDSFKPEEKESKDVFGPLFTSSIPVFLQHFYRIQDPRYYSDEKASGFWSNYAKLDRLLNDKQFAYIQNLNLDFASELSGLRFFPIIKVLCNLVMAQISQPLPFVLLAMAKVLARTKTEFWTYAQPYTFNNILDKVLQNGNFYKFLELDPIIEHLGMLGDVLVWMIPFMESLLGAQKTIAGVRLGSFLLMPRIKNSLLIKTFGCLFLRDSISLNEDENLTYGSKTLGHKILQKRDARAAIDLNAKVIIQLCKEPNWDSKESSIFNHLKANDNKLINSDASVELLRDALKYDIISLAHLTKALQRKQRATSTESFPLLWNEIDANSMLDPTFCRNVFLSIKDICQTVAFLEPKNPPTNVDSEMKNIIQSIKIHSTNTETIQNVVSKLLDKLSLSEVKDLKKLLGDEMMMNSYWSCIFCPQTNQSAVDIMYQLFEDIDGGRFESIKSLLSNYEFALQSISINVLGLKEVAAFEPCPKATRILMDVVEALASPLNGLLIDENSFRSNKNYLVSFWRLSWRYLVMIYEGALQFANSYRLDLLIEFTRDTLDLSHKLLDAYAIFVQRTSLESDNIAHQLFQDFMDTFHFVIVWLRLGDVSLLQSCVELVFKGFSLAKERNYEVDKSFLADFVKFGAKAKKYNNKLSESQKSDILSKAREFDNELVEQILIEVQEQKAKSSKSLTPVPQVQSSQLQTLYQYEKQPPKQQTLSRFGVTTQEPIRAPAPAAQNFAPNSMEAIRQSLMKNRGSAPPPKKPVADPAPARPSGFNSKKAAPQVGRSLNTLKKKKHDSDSSSEEEGEEGVDLSDLFVEKRKKAKVTEVDMSGRPLTKPSISKQLSDKKREEENMRLRLNVNLKPLYSTILKWNYNLRSDYPTKDTDIYVKTKDKYADVKDYVKTTEPLLMLECWQGIQSARETGQEMPFELLVGSRASCDGFFDVYASIKKEILQNRKISDNDLLVLGHLNGTEAQDARMIAQYLKKPDTISCMAKVREIKSANAEYFDLTIRVFPQGSMMGLLTPKSVVQGMKIMQMTTLEREYSSLKGLQYYDLADEIIQGKPEEPQLLSEFETQELRENLNLNKSQAEAVIGTFNKTGFSLIQGPPGTGKTKTILGIVGYYLAKTRNANAITGPEQQNDPKVAENLGPKVLVCAPSNAAVDELVLRIRHGVQSNSGQELNPKVVRLGRGDAINASVRDLTLEELVDKQLQNNAPRVEVDHLIREKHTQCIMERNKIRDELQSPSLLSDEVTKLEEKLREINKRRSALGQQLDSQRERLSIASRTKEVEKRQLQAKILNGAQVICSTLSGSAHEFLASMSMKFDLVIIDEACQCVELSAIIPLRYGCKKCIMVGDPNQLPPTVLSQTAASLNYEQSLFVRMQKQNPNSVYLLNVQYRMHPQISRFPSKEFYHSRLLDGPGMEEKNTRPWHKLYPLQPYMFFNVSGGKHSQSSITKSLSNESEATVILEMVEKIMEIIPPKSFSGRIGIISPYKEQIRLLKQVFRRKYGVNILDEIDFNTVDGYQGQEKEIIIMSCVRASSSGSVGFLSDIRRMNVALTRAKTSLWIFGNQDSLMRNKTWNHLILNAEERNEVIKAYPGFLTQVSKNYKPPSEVERVKFKGEPESSNSNMEMVASIKDPIDEPKTLNKSKDLEGAKPQKSLANKNATVESDEVLKPDGINPNFAKPKAVYKDKQQVKRPFSEIGNQRKKPKKVPYIYTAKIDPSTKSQSYAQQNDNKQEDSQNPHDSSKTTNGNGDVHQKSSVNLGQPLAETSDTLAKHNRTGEDKSSVPRPQKRLPTNSGILPGRSGGSGSIFITKRRPNKRP